MSIKYPATKLFFLAMLLLTRMTLAQDMFSLPECDGLRWIVNAGSLKSVQEEFSLEAQKKYFDSSCTFLVTGKNISSDYAKWHSITTRTSTSVKGIKEVSADDVAQALLYDPEVWPMTPENEQSNPVEATCEAATIAHAHGKWLMVTPAINLVRFASQDFEKGEGRFELFEKTRLAEDMAKCADIYEIQAQGAEMDTEKFRNFVSAIATQVRGANPHILVMAGISTNPMGQQVSGDQLFEAVQSVRNIVDGFWLNIPAGGEYCPRCGTPKPKVAVRLLELLSGEN